MAGLIALHAKQRRMHFFSCLVFRINSKKKILRLSSKKNMKEEPTSLCPANNNKY